MTIIHLPETDSTNSWMRRREDTGEDICVVTASQTAGRGQGTNHWESEAGKNLLFSVLTHPEGIPAAEQYQLSMAIAVAVRDAVAAAAGVDDASFTIKWPNDIYWNDCKLGGILIECSLHGAMLRSCVCGVGLNVYQQHFVSDAPNPVSLSQTADISPTLLDNDLLLSDILRRYQLCVSQPERTRERYLRHLYRRTGLHPYRDAAGTFMAETADVLPNGTLVLRDEDGRLRQYAFKEVTFQIIRKIGQKC